MLMGSIRSYPLQVWLLAAMIIRLWAALTFPTYYNYDELFQYLEQAHNLVFGGGVVSWEYQVGSRSLLIPLLLAIPMGVAHFITPAPIPGLVLIRIVMCCASLSIVWCAVKWGEQFYGKRGAWIAGGMAALWPDLWLMAPHPLEESFSAYTLVPALHLALRNKTASGSRNVLASGFLLGLSFCFREQLAFAIAVIGIYLCGWKRRYWVAAIGAAMVPFLATGIIDWIAWGEPFRSFWMNIYLNLFVGIASGFFGSSSIAYYPLNLLYDWLWAAIPLLWFAWKGARKLPVAGLAAAAIIITHSLIGHKELRFIFPAIVLLVPLAGIGLAGAIEALKPGYRALVMAALVSGPLLTPFFFMMLHWQENAFRLYAGLAKYNPCLVAIEVSDRGFWPVVAVFGKDTRFTDSRGAADADAIVAVRQMKGIPPGFVLRACKQQSWIPLKPRQPDVCFWTRPQPSCTKVEAPPFVLIYPPLAHKFMLRKD